MKMVIVKFRIGGRYKKMPPMTAEAADGFVQHVMGSGLKISKLKADGRKVTEFWPACTIKKVKIEEVR